MKGTHPVENKTFTTRARRFEVIKAHFLESTYVLVGDFKTSLTVHTKKEKRNI